MVANGAEGLRIALDVTAILEVELHVHLPIDALARVAPRDARAVLQLVEGVLVAARLRDLPADFRLPCIVRSFAQPQLRLLQTSIPSQTRHLC